MQTNGIVIYDIVNYLFVITFKSHYLYNFVW